MSQHNNQGYPNQSPSDEIDLRQVFSAIGDFFRRIGRGIINFILAIRRATIKFRLLIISCAIAGGIAGALYNYYNTEYYKAGMVLNSRYYSHDMLASVSEEMNKLAEEQSGQSLGKVLNIPVEVSANFKNITVEPLLPEEEKANLRSYLQLIKKNVTDISKEQLDSLQQRIMLNANQYSITVEAYDFKTLPQLQQGIISYLSTNPYIVKQAEVERESLQMLKESIEQDEQKLNRLKDLIAENYSKITENTRSGSNNVILGADGNSNPVNVYQQSLLLNREKARILRELSLSTEIEMVSGFTAFEVPASLSLRESVLIWMGIGIGTAYLVIILISLNRALNRYEEEKAVKEKSQLA